MRALCCVMLVAVGACAGTSSSARSLHEVDGQVVRSRPVSAGAYHAYLQARLYLEQQPPNLELAQEYVELALGYDPADPHLWTTRAEVQDARGDQDAARASLRHALQLRPDYPPARDMLARLGTAKTARRQGQ